MELGILDRGRDLRMGLCWALLLAVACSGNHNGAEVADSGSTPSAGKGSDAGAHKTNDMTAADAGQRDSGRQDSGTQDIGAQDSGTQDSGTQDSGTQDSGTQDSGAQDSGAQDSATQDSGASDSGTHDAGCKPVSEDPRATLQDFAAVLGDACAIPAGSGTKYACNQDTNDIELAGPRVFAGIGLDPRRFLRLVSPARPVAGLYDQNTIAFDAIVDASAIVISDFDFRITPGPGGKRADGLAFALLNTEQYPAGNVAPEGPCFASEEPYFKKSVGVGFDIFQSQPYDIGNPNLRGGYSNSISVHYAAPGSPVPNTCDEVGQQSQQYDVSNIGTPPRPLPPAPELAGNTWNHARIVLEQRGAESAVSVRLTAACGETSTIVDQLALPVPMPYSARAWFGARAGGETAYFDLANIRAHPLNTDQSGVSFARREVLVDETAAFVELTVTREGNLNVPLTVRYSTADESATAGIDYEPACEELVFQPGEDQKKIRIAIHDDTRDESRSAAFPGTMELVPQPDAESFTVSLSTTDPSGRVLGPAEVTVRILDDEAARRYGSWGPLLCAGIVGVHAALLPNGKVLYLDRLGNVALWTPGSTSASIPGPGYDAFCSGAAMLPDGRVLVCGGHGDPNGSGMQDGMGVANTSAFDPASATWQTLAPMNDGRWYPTVTIQSDGSALVISGSRIKDNADKYLKNLLPQVYDPASGAYRDLTGAAAQAENEQAHGGELYPRMLAIPNKVSVKVSADPVTWILDTKGTGTWTMGPPTKWQGARGYGSAVLLGKRALILGGGEDDTPPTSSVEELDLEALGAWVERQPMTLRRRQHNATVLPDGRVLVTGGCAGAGFSELETAVTPAEIYDGNGWRLLPAATVPRCYHSFALLLPEGSVLTGGGGEGAGLPTAQNDFQIYYPDYFYQLRPMIDGIPAEVVYDQPFTIETSADVSKVTVLRLGVVTHSFDQNQRFAELEFQLTPGGVAAIAPSDGWIPPGHYLVFILDNSGVPSLGEVVRIAGGP